jgi:hypothetical protein
MKIIANATLLTGLVTAFLALLVAFGVDITPDQHTAILGAVGAIVSLLGALAHPDIPVGPTTNP